MSIQNVPLGDVSTIIMGISPDGNNYNNDGVGIPLLNGPTEFSLTYPDCTLFTTQSKRECMKGDLIFCVRGNTAGRMNWADRVYSLGRGVCAIRGRSIIETKYICYCIETNLQELLQMAGGSTMPNLNQSSIKGFKIPYRENRIKIACMLSAFDDLIENNLRRIKILEEMAKTIYDEWFVKFHFPGHEKVKMVESELGLIPKGWKVKRLAEVCSILMGQSPKSKYYNTKGEGLPFHQGVTDFGERFPSTRAFCTIAGRVADPGDILFSVRAPVGRINLADCRIVIGRGLSAIRNLEGFQCFTLYQLRDIFSKEDIIGGGTIFKAVTKGDMVGIKCLYPPKDYLLGYEKVCVPISEELAVLDRKNRILRQTRDLLLPKLISGEIDVENLDIKTGETWD